MSFQLQKRKRKRKKNKIRRPKSFFLSASRAVLTFHPVISDQLPPIGMTQNNHISVEAATTLEEVARLRSDWEAMQTHPDADLDFYLTLLRTRPEILRPHVITIRREGQVESILVGRVEKARLKIALGYRSILLPPVRCLTLVGTGFFGNCCEENISALLASVQHTLKSGEADVAWFHRLEAGTSIHKRVESAGRGLQRDHFPVSGDNWGVKLPETYEELLRQRSSNTRHNVKRYSKRFQEQYAGQFEIRRFHAPEEIDALMTDTEVVARRTYHRGLNAGFINDDETRRRMSLYAGQGRLRAHILYAAGQPIAFWNGFLYGKTFYTWTTGFDPDFRDSRPGLFLLLQVFADLCEEKTIDHVDFGSGDAQYKRDWCEENRPEISFYIFAPTLKGLALNALRTPLLAGSQAARWGLSKTNLLEKTRKLWRSRLAQRSQLEGT
jgi:hypothetical protein